MGCASTLQCGSGDSVEDAGREWLGASNANACKPTFLDLSSGRYEVLLDNIVIHRFDGSEVVIYATGPIPDLDLVDTGTTHVTTEVTVVPVP